MKENNTLGIVSLILGILAALSSLIFIISIPLAIASAICGIIALAKKKKKAMPIIGIVLSIISILFSAGIILLVGVVFSNINDDDIRSALVRAYNNTTSESEKLVRLPMYYGLTKEDQDKVIKAIKEFYAKN